MSGKKKAVIIAIPIAAFLIILIGIGSRPYVNTNADEIAGITQFHVLEDGSLTKFRFSLVDHDGNVAASDADIFLDTPNYTQNFTVSASQFQEYKLVLTGQPVIALAWQSDQDFGEGDVHVTVTLPNGKVFTASDRIF